MYANRYRHTVAHKEQDIYVVISRQLNDLENVVGNEEEMIALLRELLCVLNINNVSLAAFRAFSKWIETKPGNGITVRSLLKTIGVAVKDMELLAELLEVTITSYFMNMGKSKQMVNPKTEQSLSGGASSFSKTQGARVIHALA